MTAHKNSPFMNLQFIKDLMAPKVEVPMDFGGHLRESPSHNNLKLNTSDGGEVWASSVILSFNSPVIDHMTTTLHMTSVDMLEFSEAAVQVFVDSAYSGKAEGITWKIFRDINKMANVFEVTWLVSKCYQHFTNLAKSVKSGSYKVQLFLFEEAGFVYENLKSKDFLSIAVKKIESLNCKQQFLERYLENAERLSTKELDTVIELAGNDVNFLVQTLVDQLSKIWKTQGPILPLHCRYLLDNSRLYILCQKDKYRSLFNELFDILKDLPNDEMKWTLELHRKSTENTLLGAGTHSESRMSSLAGRSGVGDSRKSSKTVIKQSSIIQNVYHSFVLEMSFGELLKWLSQSGHVTSLMMAIDAVWMWCRYNTHCVYIDEIKHPHIQVLYDKLLEMAKSRQWPRLPLECMNFGWKFYTGKDWMNFHWFRFCVQLYETNSQYMIIDSMESCPKPLDVLSKFSKLTFHFKHPYVTYCSRPGKCGFILKTVPSDKALWKLRMCTEEEDYYDEPVHFHDQIRAENMHIFFAGSRSRTVDTEYFPLSWFGSISAKEIRKIWESQFIYHRDDSGFKVLYRVGTLY